jgi:hypothetical protein
MTKYQEYSNRILEVHARFRAGRPESKFHNGPMEDKEYGDFLQNTVKEEFGISWQDVENAHPTDCAKEPDRSTNSE